MANPDPHVPIVGSAEEADATQAEPTAESSQREATPAALLRQAELKAQEHHDAWLRAKAEADNIRKRAQIDIANAHKYAIENFAVELLPVKDSLEAALAADAGSVEAIRSGVEITLKQLAAVFEKASLAEINPANQKFDPHQHQAISMLPSDKEPNTVINVLQKGYRLHDRVIRPALVTVSKAKES
jgi:molecular chaperone GrpE